jgi:transposase
MAIDVFTNRIFGLQGTNFQVVDLKPFDDDSGFEFTIWHKKEGEYECSGCGELHYSYYDRRDIILKDLPMGNKSVRWRVRRVRLQCHCSPGPRAERLCFRGSNHQLTRRMQDYCADLLCTKMFTVKDVSRLLNLNYGTCYKIDHATLFNLVQHLQIPHATNISVDEKSAIKGHKYVTIITDVDRGKAIWTSSGNSRESLDEYFKIIGPEGCAKIKTIAKDGHKPYAASCNEFVPHALQVTDKFHLVKRLSEAVDSARKEMIGDPNNPNIKLPHGTHWILRHREENLKDYQLTKLEHLKKNNEKLYEVYLLKEKFFYIFEYAPHQVNRAAHFLSHWIDEAVRLKLKAMNDFITHLVYHHHTILNIIRTGLSSAVSEGINRKINVIKAMAYGYKNIQYFKLKILQRCGYLQPGSKLITHYKS